MVQYIKGALREFKYIRWMSLGRTSFLTLIVILTGLSVGFALGALDSSLSSVLRSIVI